MADDKTDKDLERQYRKNLMVVACIVLIYSIAGGQMGDDLTMLGAKLKFSRPDWLEYAMVAVMCFFWWRHWQVSAGIRKVHNRDAALGTRIPDRVVEHLIANGVSTTAFLYLDDPWFEVRVNRKFYDEFGPSANYLLLLVKPFSVFLANAEYYDNQHHEPMSGKMVKVESMTHKVLIIIALLKSYISCAIKKPEFGDGLLPGFMSYAALCAWLLNKLFHHSDVGKALWIQVFQQI